ncbi:MAG: cytidine/deoxycytidylate deaminase family protein [Thermoanaerobaculia bacterium]|nr:cytidine/deoxycytidylate deaminase family protein [Thermoanaerobaculia bacterium]
MTSDATRPSWDEYFIRLVDEVASRATCDRGRSGCVIVRDKRIICTGYVGSPPGLAHCDEHGHYMKQMVDEDGTIRNHCVRTIHAEQNAICQAARDGLSLKGTTLYCTMEPCRVCAMLITSVGIRRVVAKRRYHAAQDTRDTFREAGVQLDVLEDRVEEYENQAVAP